MRPRRLLLVLGIVLLTALMAWLLIPRNEGGEGLPGDRPGEAVESPAPPSLMGTGDASKEVPADERVANAPSLAASAVTRDEIPPFAVTGTVRQEDSGLPIAGAVVHLIPQRLGVVVESFATLRARTDTEGRFCIPGALPGSWLIFPTHPLHANPLVDAMFRGDAPRDEPPEAFFVEVPGTEAGSLDRDLRMSYGPRLMGTVLDQDGSPVAGAEIHARKLPFVSIAYRYDVMAIGRIAQEPIGRSDAEGHFVLSCLPAAMGEASLGACDARHAGLWSEPLPLGKGRDIEGLVLRVERMAAVSGRVLNQQGKAVGGVEVHLVAGEHVWTKREEVRCDTDGSFHLPAVPPGSVDLHARSEGRVACHGELEGLVLQPAQMRSGVEIVVTCSQPTFGRLRDGDGRSLAGEHVVATESGTADEDGDYGVFLARDETDAEGRFALAVEVGVQIDIFLAEPRGHRLLASGVRAPAAELDLVATPTPRHRIDVRVLLPDGSPVALFVANARVGRRLRRSTESVQGLAGRATLEVRGSPPIGLHLSEFRDAEGRSLPYDAVERTLDAAPASEVLVRLAARGGVRGYVVGPRGEPLPGVTVRTFHRGGRLETTTSQDGSFVVTGIHADHRTVRVSVLPPPGFSPPRWQEADVGGEPLRFVLRPGGRLSGRVTATGVVDLSDAEVLATWEPLRPDEGASVEASVGADGSFTLDGIPAERDVTLRLLKGSDAAEQGLYAEALTGVRAGSTDLVLALQQGLSIRGVVTLGDGQLVDAVLLEVTATHEMGNFRRTEMPEIEGRTVPFELHGLRPGRYRVRVEHGQHLLVELDGVRAGTHDLEIALPELTSVEGRVLGLPPGEEARVVARLRGAEDEAEYDWVDISDAEGVFEVRDVPADGVWIVSAEVRDKGLIGVTEDVAAGRHDVVIRLQEGLTIEGRVARADGTPPPKRWFLAVGHGHLAYAWSEEDGTFRLGPLLPGTVRIEHHGPTLFGEDVVVEGVEAGTKDLEILLP